MDSILGKDNLLITKIGIEGDSSSSGENLLARYLQDQQSLTAVHKFSQRHSDVTRPLQERYYRDLLPLAKPTENQQYAFEVDLDLCTGCKSCVSGCNSLNGLEPEEAWRDVGLLHGGNTSLTTLSSVTTSCHHCVEPACATGCPVNAYEKSPTTGIVKHLDDQCIGCQYCMLTCPYEVPKFSKTLGIVRKCDMCTDRLEEGEAPACVQACPTKAISITVVDTQGAIRSADAGPMVPGAPPSDITFPTTVYKTARPELHSMLPADFYTPRKEANHAPLVAMLVTMQMSTGIYALDLLLRWGLLGESGQSLAGYTNAIGFAACILGLLGSFFHLGRPLYAFRAVVGLGHSWLSREILAFGLFAGLAGAYTLGLSFQDEWKVGASTLTGLNLGVAGMALLGLICSVMVYHATRRIFWHGIRTGPKFGFTCGILGASSLLVLCTALSWAEGPASLAATNALAPLSLCLGLCLVFKLTGELWVLSHLRDLNHSSLKRTAKLHWDVMWVHCAWRIAFGICGGIGMPIGLMMMMGHDGVASVGALVFVALGFAMTFAGELLERYLFFTAVVALKMPGRMPG